MTNVFLTVTIGPDYRLLPYFLRYYKNLGIKNFLVILNTSDTLAMSILQEHGINPVISWTEPFSERLKQLYEREVVLRYCSNDDWVLYTDLDEFQHYPMGLQECLKRCDNIGVEYLDGRLIDRVSDTGELITLDVCKSLDEQFPLGGYLTNNLLKAWDRKIGIAKGKLIVGGGHHIFLENATYKNLPYKKRINKHSYDIEIHHFKWDREVLIRMNRYLQLKDDSLIYWRKEILRFLSHYSKHNIIDVYNKKFVMKKVTGTINI
jgi:hypothetical protein